MQSSEREVVVPVPSYSESSGLTLSWVGDYRLSVRVLGNGDRGHEVVVMGNAAGLQSLARAALALAQAEVPSGFHVHWEDATVLDAPSAPFVLEREDDPDEYDR